MVCLLAARPHGAPARGRPGEGCALTDAPWGVGYEEPTCGGGSLSSGKEPGQPGRKRHGIADEARNEVFVDLAEAVAAARHAVPGDQPA